MKNIEIDAVHAVTQKTGIGPPTTCTFDFDYDAADHLRDLYLQYPCGEDLAKRIVEAKSIQGIESAVDAYEPNPGEKDRVHPLLGDDEIVYDRISRFLSIEDTQFPIGCICRNSEGLLTIATFIASTRNTELNSDLKQKLKNLVAREAIQRDFTPISLETIFTQDDPIFSATNPKHWSNSIFIELD